MLLTILFWLDGLDSVLALTNLIYAILLIRLGLGGSDALGWVEVHRSKAVLVMPIHLEFFLVALSIPPTFDRLKIKCVKILIPGQLQGVLKGPHPAADALACFSY